MQPDTNSKAFSAQSTSKPPVKQKYARDRRTYLTKTEVEAVAEAASKRGRYGTRDALMILTAYRHGLRATELVNLRAEAVNLEANSLAVTRAKNGKSTVHPFVNKQERKDWVSWMKQQEGEFLFEGERGPLSEHAFHKIVQAAGKAAGFEFPVHPHMLRHATGYELTNNDVNPRIIQDFLGHKDIKHTMQYTELAPNAFKKVKDLL